MQKNNWQKESVLENKYKIKNVLEEGVLGDSYAVEHFEWDMLLRLKRFSASCFENNEAVQYLKNAIAKWISLQGFCHIAHAYYWETIDGELCLISEYIKGQNLSTYTTENKERALSLCIELGCALEIAHQKKLPHGALTKQNIIIGDDGVLYLNDFTGIFTQIYRKQIAFESFVENKEYKSYDQYLKDIRAFGNIVKESVLDRFEDESFDEITKFVNVAINTPENIDIVTFQRNLKKTYENSTGTSYKKTNIIPARLESERCHKHAFSYMESGEIAQAEILWSRAANKTPGSINALWNWHLLNLRKGMISLDTFLGNLEDLKTIEHSQLVCAQAKLALETGCKIHNILDKVREAKRTDTTSDLLRMEGELFYRIRDFEKAIESFRALNDLDDTESDDWYRLAITYVNAEKLDEANEVVEKGLDIYPQHILLQLVKITILHHKGQLELCKTLFDELLEKYSDVFWVLMNVAEFYAGEGIFKREVSSEDKKIACEHYRKVLKINPNLHRAIRGYNNCGGTGVPDSHNYSLKLESWSEIKLFKGHPNMITSIAMTPDGLWAVSGDCDGNIFLWDVKSEVCITRLEGHRKHITSLAMTPDGKKIISGSWDKTVRVWESLTGRCLWEISEHTDKVSSVDITKDGSYFISGGWDGVACVWDLEAQELYGKFETTGSWITDVTIFNDGQLAITCDENEQMCLWEVMTKNVTARMRGITVKISANEKKAISSRYDFIEIWDIPSGKIVDRIFTQGKEICLAMNKECTLLLTKNDDDILTTWDLVNRRQLSILHAEDALCASMTDDARYIISGSHDLIYIWENITERSFPLFRHSHYLPSAFRDTLKIPEMILNLLRKAEIASENGEYGEAFQIYQNLKKIPGYEKCETVTRGHYESAQKANYIKRNIKYLSLLRETKLKGSLSCFALDKAGDIITVACDDDPIHVYDCESGYQKHLLNGHYRCISSVFIQPSGKHVISGSWDGSAIVWDIENLSFYDMFEKKNMWVTATSISHDGLYALIGMRDGSTFLWNLNTLESTLLREEERHNVHVSYVGFTNTHAYSAYVDGTVYIFDLEEKTCIANYKPHERFMTCFEVLEDGRVLSSSRNGCLFLWDLLSGDIIRAYPHTGEVIRKAKSYDKNVFFTASDNGLLRLWNYESSESLFTKQIHDAPVVDMDISGDMRFLATGDNTCIKLWEIEWIWEN